METINWNQSLFFFDNDSNEDADNDLEHVDACKGPIWGWGRAGRTYFFATLATCHWQLEAGSQQGLLNQDIAVKVKDTLSFMK